MVSREPVFSSERAACMGLSFLRPSHLIQTASHIFPASGHCPACHTKAFPQVSHAHSRRLRGSAGSSIACGSRCMEFAHHLRGTSKRVFWSLNIGRTDLLPMDTNTGYSRLEPDGYDTGQHDGSLYQFLDNDKQKTD